MGQHPSTPNLLGTTTGNNLQIAIRPVAGPEVHELFRFRHDVFCSELRWLPPSAETPGVLRDHYDEVAHNYAAFDERGAVVGSVRVVPDSPVGLPIERNVGLGGFRELMRPAEISRLAVATHLRRTPLSLLLMKAAYQCARLRGHDFIVLDTYLDPSNQTLALYERIGFERLAEPYEDPAYRNPAPVLALGLDCERAERTLSVRDPELFGFFRGTTDSPIEHS